MKKIGKAALCVLCAAVLLAMGMFLFQNNSPLYQHIGPDNAIFMTIGRGMAQGKVPYVDLTENKGPLFFLLMGVPQMIIEGTTGVFILEEIMLLGMCLMIVLCARWLTGGKPWALCAALGVAAYLSSMNGGNFCEEYDQFFLMMGVTVMVHVFTAQKKGEKWRSFVMGLATASVALIKISDILGLAMLVLCYIVWVIREKKGFWKEALRFVAGMAVVAIPVFAYLISVDAVGAMFEDYILNNFVHVAKGKGYGFMETRLYLLERSYGRTALKAAGGMIAAVIVCLLLKFGKRDGRRIVYCSGSDGSGQSAGCLRGQQRLLSSSDDGRHHESFDDSSYFQRDSAPRKRVEAGSLGAIGRGGAGIVSVGQCGCSEYQSRGMGGIGIPSVKP